MELETIIGKYLAAAGDYGRPAAISAFGLGHADAERLFRSFDEDYHISRFFHFSNSSGETFDINGFPQTHVSIDAAIKEIL